MKIKSPSRTVSRAVRQRNTKTNAAGRKLMAALEEIIAAENGENVAPLIKRTIDIPEPRTYLPGDVKKARQQLGISQRVFRACWVCLWNWLKIGSKAAACRPCGRGVYWTRSCAIRVIRSR